MEKIGRYSILRRLGGGGFGEVWLGFDEAIRREVAIKVFKPKDENLIAFATSSATEGLDVLQTRFVTEAQILASLEDAAHVINVLEFGELDDGSPYYVMPYLPHSLSDLLGKDVFDARAFEELPEADRPRALPLDQALKLLEQLLLGLAAAHAKGLIHRDIKPGNIMLTESGDVRLVDFGIAKAPDGGHSTVSQLGMGSRNYMAPEQRESAKHVDASADIYAVGAVAYRMITGRLAQGRFADPNVQVPELSQSLNDLIVDCLNDDHTQRPQSAGELLELFRQAWAQQGQIDEATGTWVSPAESSLRDELKPLRDQVEKLLLEHGEIPSGKRELLDTLGAVADIDSQGVDNLIESVALGLSDQLKPIQNFLARVDDRIAAGLDATRTEALYVAGEAIGWDQSKVDAAIQARGVQPAVGGDGGSSTIAGEPAQSGNSRSLGKVIAVLVVLAVVGGGALQLMDQQRIAEEQQRLDQAQQAAAQKAEQAKIADAQKAADEQAERDRIADEKRIADERAEQQRLDSERLAREKREQDQQAEAVAWARADALNTVEGYEEYLALSIASTQNKAESRRRIKTIKDEERAEAERLAKAEEDRKAREAEELERERRLAAAKVSSTKTLPEPTRVNVGSFTCGRTDSGFSLEVNGESIHLKKGIKYSRLANSQLITYLGTSYLCEDYYNKSVGSTFSSSTAFASSSTLCGRSSTGFTLTVDGEEIHSRKDIAYGKLANSQLITYAGNSYLCDGYYDKPVGEYFGARAIYPQNSQLCGRASNGYSLLVNGEEIHSKTGVKYAKLGESQLVTYGGRSYLCEDYYRKSAGSYFPVARTYPADARLCGRSDTGFTLTINGEEIHSKSDMRYAKLADSQLITYQGQSYLCHDYYNKPKGAYFEVGRVYPGNSVLCGRTSSGYSLAVNGEEIHSKSGVSSEKVGNNQIVKYAGRRYTCPDYYNKSMGSYWAGY